MGCYGHATAVDLQNIFLWGYVVVVVLNTGN